MVDEEAVAEGTREVKYLDNLPRMDNQWQDGMPALFVDRWDTGVEIVERLWRLGID